MSKDVPAGESGRHEMTLRATESAQCTVAKVAGLLYLIQMATGVFGFYAHGRLTVAGDPVQTAKNIVASERLFRIGTVSDLTTAVVVVVLAWALYVVLRPINRNVALLAVFLRLAENSIAASAIFTDFIALRLLSDVSYLQGFDAQQVQLLARVFTGGQGAGLQIAFVFLGLGSALFSYLWLKSRYVPRALAALGIFGSLVLTIGTLIIMVFPALGAVGLTYMMPLGIYEVGLGLWLLVKGIQAPSAHQGHISSSHQGPGAHRPPSLPDN